MADSVVNIANNLATLGQANARSSFEYSFMQIQNTIAGRLNAEIDKIRDVDNTKAEFDTLQRKSKQIERQLPLISNYLIVNESNGNRLSTIYDDLTSLGDSFLADSDNTDATASEVAAFETRRDAIVANMRNLYLIYHPDIVDGNIIANLKNEMDTLSALTPVVGTVDPSGTDPSAATNDNRAILDYIATLQDKISNAITSTDYVSYVGLEMQMDYQTKIAEYQARLTDMTVVGVQQKIDQIDELKLKYANVLKAISISYEVSASFADYLNERLHTQVPESGSVLNLFI